MNSQRTRRKSLSKKTRFEVFKRDSFKCQYCGADGANGNTVLHVDHIKPVASGGTNSILNLITACQLCNSGKGAVELSDETALARQKATLDSLQQRREQTLMVAKWREELSTIEDSDLIQAAELWKRLVTGYSLNEIGLNKLRAWIAQFGYDSIQAAIKIACAQYLRLDKDGKVTKDSVEVAFGKVGGICFNRQRLSKGGRS